MSDFMRHAEAIQRLERMFRPVLEAADFLRDIGSIEQAKNEIVGAKARADAELVVRKGALEQVNAEITTARAALTDAEGVAERVGVEARATAVRIVAGAQADGVALVEKALAEQALVVTATAIAVQGRKDAEAKRVKAEADLAAVEEQLAKVRKAAASIAGV